MSADPRRVLVLLTGPGKTAAELDELYGKSNSHRYRGRQPGEHAILAQLERLREAHAAQRDAEGRWKLTPTGQRHWDALEREHTRSGGEGNHGF